MSTPNTGHPLARAFFWPVYYFIEKVRFARSFLLLFLLIPDIYIAYLLYQQTTNSVEFSAKESVGVAYITPVRAFLANLQRIRVVGALPGGAGMVEQSALLTKGDELMAAVEKVEASYGAVLNTSATWKQARDLWGQVKLTAIKEGRPNETQITELTTLLAGELIFYKAGNNSNLILDPDLDSYWMMDAFVVKLPILGEFTASAGSAGIRALEDNKLTTQERLDLAATSGLIAATTSDLINIDLKTALDDNEKYNEGRMGSKELRPALEKPFLDTAKALNAFTERLRTSLLQPDLPQIDAAAMAKEAAAIIDQIHDLQIKVGPQLDKLCLDRAERFRHTRLLGIITFLIAALLISYVFNGFTSSVQGQQEKLVEENKQLQGDILGLLTVVSDAADGNLTVRAKVTEGALGNIADAFNQMMESWQQLVTAILTQLDKTNHAVDELRKSADTMAKGASTQATEVLAATTSVQRMSEKIEQVSGNAETAAGAAKRTQESALKGSDSVQNVMLGMDSLRSLVQSGAKKIKSLGDRSMEINSIVGTITKISEQTNMLALNAAIEAARAGEQGRGFSVVADEVRKLAERTAAATQEIEKLVRTIQSETTESVDAIERQTQVVEDEGKAVAEAGNALNRIQDMSSQSSNLVTDIAVIARNQVTDAATVVSTMQRISTIAQDTEHSAQGSQHIAQELGALSKDLKASMGRFKVS